MPTNKSKSWTKKQTINTKLKQTKKMGDRLEAWLKMELKSQEQELGDEGDGHDSGGLDHDADS